MIREFLLVPLFALGLVLVTAVPATATTAEGITGLWTSVDPADGSSQSLLVTASSTGTFRLAYFDSRATVACDSVGFVASGRASLVGDTLRGSIRGICFDGSLAGPFAVEFTYHPGPPETLTDGFGAVWTNPLG